MPGRSPLRSGAGATLLISLLQQRSQLRFHRRETCVGRQSRPLLSQFSLQTGLCLALRAQFGPLDELAGPLGEQFGSLNELLGSFGAQLGRPQSCFDLLARLLLPFGAQLGRP